METSNITPGMPTLSSSSSKSMKIKFEGKKNFCQIQVIEDSIQAEITLDNKFKYKGNIFLEKIQSQIKAFLDYNIYEIYEEINQLNTNNFSIIKKNNKYKLVIEFMILRKKKNIIIDLKENTVDDDMVKKYESIIKEKDYIISNLKEQIAKTIINNYENLIKGKDNLILELNEKIKKLEEKIKENEKKKKKKKMKMKNKKKKRRKRKRRRKRNRRRRRKR